MSFTDKRLCSPTQLTTSGQTIYTVPASKTSIIKQIVVTNVTSSPATFSLYIGSAATPNALFNATSVAGNDTIIINLSQILNQLETLTALASANSTLNITISGVENDGPLNPLSTYIADSAITTAKLANNSVTQSRLASNLSGVTVTTSSTRSTDVPSPFDGQAIYETDTNRLLVWDGSAWIVVNGGASGYLYVQRNYYTSTGTHTFTKASYPWLRAIRVMCQGAGGASGGCVAIAGISSGSGGGGGGYAESFITNISGLASSVTITVGAGGTPGGAGNTNGGAGGNSSFGSTVIGNGGGGGNGMGDVWSAFRAGGTGGSGTGDLVIDGDDGGIAVSEQSGQQLWYAYTNPSGGGSFLGAVMNNNSTTLAYNARAGRLYGGGASGPRGHADGGTGSRNGAAGANGIVIVELYA